MFDRAATALIKPLVDRGAALALRAGISANQLTLGGFALGMLAALLVGCGQFGGAVLAMLLSRLCDALDGAAARQSRVTDAGAFLDITLDFLFYAAVALAFAFADPQRNALASAVLLASFVGTGSSFLADAVLAARRGMDNAAYPDKSFYFLGGLTEAAETLAFFIAMCLWPAYFPQLAYAFAALCGVTTATRIAWGWRSLR